MIPKYALVCLAQECNVITSLVEPVLFLPVIVEHIANYGIMGVMKFIMPWVGIQQSVGIIDFSPPSCLQHLEATT